MGLFLNNSGMHRKHFFQILNLFYLSSFVQLKFCLFFVCEALDGEVARRDSDVFLDENDSHFGRQGTIMRILC